MEFTNLLLSWYNNNHRDLPWRRTSDPYKIWISEIILQQTRIDQGLSYYHRFLEKFQTVAQLAAGSEEDVLKQWQGLGYYSRARNLHHAAREIVIRYHGVFPSDYEAIRHLKGIGDYTAAAIASITFGLPYPVVDGNVLRFFSRYFGISDPVDMASGKKKVLDLAREKMHDSDPGTFNQAVMEFGALQCKPGMPGCDVCPFRTSCFAFTNGKVIDLPVKSSSLQSRKRYFSYLVMIYQDPKKGPVVYFKKREENDIWKNLYDFPMIESSGPISLSRLMKSPDWKSILKKEKNVIPERSRIYQHILSHQLIYARFYVLRLKKRPKNSFVSVKLDDLDKIPVPRLIEKFLSLYPLFNHTRHNSSQ